eukprot:TRINITY_DN69972_c0_g1_i1.p1 TRINITY_DN69972_c0_g1~~TRINITY_DN69972_c0_g1_i1.p1  ORF type:complete len:597 (+),score=124.42 TRINITY_DN69972_c0_g1_i1:92-1792(+)
MTANLASSESGGSPEVPQDAPPPAAAAGSPARAGSQQGAGSPARPLPGQGVPVGGQSPPPPPTAAALFSGADVKAAAKGAGRVHQDMTPLSLPQAPPKGPGRRRCPSASAGGEQRRPKRPPEDGARRTGSARNRRGAPASADRQLGHSAGGSASFPAPQRGHAGPRRAGNALASVASRGAPAHPQPPGQRRPLTHRPPATSAPGQPSARGSGAATNRQRSVPGGLRSHSVDRRQPEAASGGAGATGGAARRGLLEPVKSRRRSATPSPPPPAPMDGPPPAGGAVQVRDARPGKTPGGGRRRAASPPAAGRPRANRFIPVLPLPPRAPDRTWTAVLDLDQTLVNAHGADDAVITRPGMQKLLETLGRLRAERVLWTASNEAQVRFVLRRLGAAGKMLEHVVTWDTKGWQHFPAGGSTTYNKDLAKLDRPMHSTLLLDNDPLVVRPHLHNALVVDDFGDGHGRGCRPDDNVLPAVGAFLEEMCAAHPEGLDIPAHLQAHCRLQPARGQAPAHWCMPGSQPPEAPPVQRSSVPARPAPQEGPGGAPQQAFEPLRRSSNPSARGARPDRR